MRQRCSFRRSNGRAWASPWHGNRTSGSLVIVQREGNAAGLRCPSWMSVAVLMVGGLLLLALGLWARRQPAASLVGEVEAASGARESACMAGSALTVQPGDSLWKLAQRCASPGDDPRRWVEAFRRRNGLSATHRLQPGETLFVPLLPGGQQGVNRAAGPAAP